MFNGNMAHRPNPMYTIFCRLFVLWTKGADYRSRAVLKT